jgi:putative tryptophan/tyrosine transport system substrate-binding protein
MKRREFMALLGGAAAAWPFSATAQDQDRVRRIGVLFVGAETDPATKPHVTVLQQALQDLGWVEGRNIKIENRFAGGDADRVKIAAQEIIELQPDVILAGSTPALAALHRATSTIPIVFIMVTDPVGGGFVKSFANPGGNITGFTFIEFTMGGKWLELLKEFVPSLARVALLFNLETAPYAGLFLPAIKSAAATLAVTPVEAPVRSAAEIERAIDGFARSPNGGLIVFPDVTAVRNRDLIVALAARHRLPAIYPWREFVGAGGLICYGADPLDLRRRAASYIDRILRGANPGDLPVQAPTKFELVVNLKTAETLGLTIPQSILLQADEVIE